MDFRSLVPNRSTVPGRSQGEDPFYPLRREMERAFDDFFRGGMPTAPGVSASAAVPVSLDVSENDDKLTVTAEVPGVKEDDLDVSITGDVLTIKGEKNVEDERKEDDYHVVERSYGSFQRSLRLPFDVDEQSVDARFKNGILTIDVPKPKEEQSKARKVQIKSEG